MSQQPYELGFMDSVIVLELQLIYKIHFPNFWACATNKNALNMYVLNLCCTPKKMEEYAIKMPPQTNIRA